MKKFFSKTIRMIGFHGLIFLRGLCSVVFGTLFVLSLAIGIYGFGQVANAGGYDAVGSFLISVGTVFVAVLGIYLMGLRTKWGVTK